MPEFKTRADFEYNEVHYRLFRSFADDVTPIAVAMQDFDYYEVDASRFIGEAAFDSEAEALDAIDVLTGSDFGKLRLRAEVIGVPEGGKTRSSYPDEVHYRLYWPSHFDEPTTVCVQWFDYYDYDERRFLGEQAFDTEEEAEAALQRLLSDPL